MKLTTWNCNGALRRKLQAVDGLASDVLIVQECEDPSQSTADYMRWAGDYIWEGETKNKGIGIFARPGVKISRLNWQGSFSALPFRGARASWSTAELRQFIPFSIEEELVCVAVWTKGRSDEVFGYMGQFWKFLQIHKDDLPKGRAILAGDFNSNKIWDKRDRWWNHTDVVMELAGSGIKSLYHEKTGEEQGEEKQATFFHQRNPQKPYHIDYIFASTELCSRSNVTVGAASEWLELSDHLPLTMTLAP